MKILITGLGSIGQRHLRNIKKLFGDSVEVIAFRQRNNDRVLNSDMTVNKNKNLEKVFKLKSYYDIDEALSEKPSVTIISNPNVLHIPIAIKAARVGSHLYIEKELSDSWDGIDELTEIVKSKGLITYIGYQRRFHHGYRKIKKLIDNKFFGNILSVYFESGENIKDWHPYESYKDLHAAVPELGGGSLSHQTHEINLLLWYFGLPEKVFAIGGPLSNLNLEVEDSVDILFGFKVHGKPLPAYVHIDYLQRPHKRICKIIGDNSCLEFDFYKNQIIIEKNNSRELINLPKFDRDEMFISSISKFFQCVKNNTKTSHDLEEGKKMLKVSLAAKNSLQTGKVIII